MTYYMTKDVIKTEFLILYKHMLKAIFFFATDLSFLYFAKKIGYQFNLS